MKLNEAIDVLVKAHTRDDDSIGFLVSSLADVSLDGDRKRYQEAWRVVRETFGYQTSGDWALRNEWVGLGPKGGTFWCRSEDEPSSEGGIKWRRMVHGEKFGVTKYDGQV